MKKLSLLFIFLFALVLLPNNVSAALDCKAMNGFPTVCKGESKCTYNSATSECKNKVAATTPAATTPAATTPAATGGTSAETSGTGLGSAMGKLQNTVSGSGLEADLETTLGAIIKGALSLVGTVFLILTVYAGILWMTARGDDAQIEKSTKIIRASVIGLFITLSAYAITYYITERLTQAT
jgi:hypothetical protein